MENVPYLSDGDSSHVLDIHRPNAIESCIPVVMYIHGGGFTVGSKETHRPVALAYSEKGYLVFNVNYRLAPIHRFPAALDDVCMAYLWIVGNAGRFGGDTNRIILAGESAGANLALSLALACCYRSQEPISLKVWDTGVVPKAVQLMCGFLQVSNPGRFNHILPPYRKSDLLLNSVRTAWNTFQLEMIHNVSANYICPPNDTIHARGEQADPLNLLESDRISDRPLPAFFAMAGTADWLQDDTRRLEAALEQKQAVKEIRYYQGEEHVFHFMWWRKEAKRFWDDCWAFLENYV